jgi:hypothetical protein
MTHARDNMTVKGIYGMEKQPPVLRAYLLGTFKTELPDGAELAMNTLFGRIHSMSPNQSSRCALSKPVGVR